MVKIPVRQLRQAMALIDQGKIDREELLATQGALKNASKLLGIKDTTIHRLESTVEAQTRRVEYERERAEKITRDMAALEKYYKKTLRAQKRKTLGMGILMILSTVGTAYIFNR